MPHALHDADHLKADPIQQNRVLPRSAPQKQVLQHLVCGADEAFLRVVGFIEPAARRQRQLANGVDGGMPTTRPLVLPKSLTSRIRPHQHRAIARTCEFCTSGVVVVG